MPQNRAFAEALEPRLLLASDGLPGPQITPPWVTEVLVSGKTWKPQFLDRLEAAGFGRSQGGYRVDVDDLTTLPWSNIDQVTIRYNQQVKPSPADLDVSAGDNLVGRHVSGFNFDPPTRSATWALNAPLGSNRLVLRLPDQTEANGATVDASLRAFLRNVDVSIGDVNGNGTTDVFDAGQIRAGLGMNAGEDGYSIFADINGDARIDVDDLTPFRSRLGRRLPPIHPKPPIRPGSVHGRKWIDENGNGRIDQEEPGLADVTIYLDANGNGQLDEGEQNTKTIDDDPSTTIDETGIYWLAPVTPGWHFVREVGPGGFTQTFPGPSMEIRHAQSQTIQPGLALDLTIGDLGRHSAPGGNAGIEVPVTVVWRNTCGALIPQLTQSSVSGHRIEIEMFGQQVGSVCGQALTPETQVIDLGPLSPGSYAINVGLNEQQPKTGFVETMAAHGELVVDAGGHKVHVLPGTSANWIDFGNQPAAATGAIHGLKWIDQDGNGRRNRNEPGLPDVTVYIDLNHNGQLDRCEPRTKTTADDPDTAIDETGRYQLNNLPPTNHQIQDVVPDDFVQTFPGPDRCGSQPATMTDDRGAVVDETGRYWRNHPPSTDYQIREIVPDDFVQTFPGPDRGSLHKVVLAAGQTVENIDFGNQREPDPVGSIHGIKWLDENGNGERDQGEPGLPGVTIFVDVNLNSRFDTHEPHTKTMEDDPVTDFDESGQYGLKDLPAGEHYVNEVVPFGFVQTYPSPVGILIYPPPHAMTTSATHLDAVQQELNTQRQQWQALNLRDYIYHFERICFCSPEYVDPGLVHVVGGEIDSVEHAVTGDVLDPSLFLTVDDLFDEVQAAIDSNADEIVVEYDGILGNPTTINIDFSEYMADEEMSFRASDLRVIPGPGIGAHKVILEPGNVVEGIDFGNKRKQPPAIGSIQGIKWLDADHNGRRDQGEPGLPGVTIYTDLNRNGILDDDEQSTLTMEDNRQTDFDETGRYELKDLPPGEYWIAEVVPDGFVQTFPSHPVIAIFPPPPGGGVHKVELESGDTIEGIDFGNQRKPPPASGSIQGIKWFDKNGNGKRDFQEPGLPGITIYLDLNHNGNSDPGEPRTKTMQDSPLTAVDETGRYWLKNIPPGVYSVGEVVPDGWKQTFPGPVAKLSNVTVQPIGASSQVRQFDAISVSIQPAAIPEQAKVETIFEVAWNTVCSSLLSNLTSHTIKGDEIRVDLFGRTRSLICVKILGPPEQQAVVFDNLAADTYDLTATLHEARLRLLPFDHAGLGLDNTPVVNVNDSHDVRRLFEPTWKLSAKLDVATAGSHRVQVGPGQTVVDIDFGNRRKFPNGIVFSEAATGQSSPPSNSRPPLPALLRDNNSPSDSESVLDNWIDQIMH